MNEKSHSPAKRASVALPLLITLVCASISTSQSPAPAEAYQVTVQTGVRVKMRDGPVALSPRRSLAPSPCPSVFSFNQALFD